MFNPEIFTENWTAVAVSAFVAAAAIIGMFTATQLLSARRKSETKPTTYECGIPATPYVRDVSSTELRLTGDGQLTNTLRGSSPSADTFEVRHSLILFNISVAYPKETSDPYEATSYAWRANLDRLEQYDLVLGHARGVVVGAYRPLRWIPATVRDFPLRLKEDSPGRWGFVGEPADKEIWQYYVGKRVPEKYRSQNPVRYCDKPA